MKFFALDTELANPDMTSICQIGVAEYQNGQLINQWSTLVNPLDYFLDLNVSIHGISENMVSSAPIFAQISPDLNQMLHGQIVVCHTHFDRTSLARTASKYGTAQINCTWLDSARVARRAWPQFARKGYGIDNLNEFLGYRNKKRHDALEDAKAAGNVILAAIKQTGVTLDDWIVKSQKRISPKSSQVHTQDGNPDGPLFGEILVFTGALQIPRREAAAMAAEAGCKVTGSVSSKTTLLVVGDQDIRNLAGHAKSSKHRKAEQLIAKGSPIRILQESDFKELLQQT